MRTSRGGWIALLIATGCAAGSGDPVAYSKRGTWRTAVAETIVTCTTDQGVWGFNADGTVEHFSGVDAYEKWTLPEKPTTWTVNFDCHSAWIAGADRRALYYVNDYAPGYLVSSRLAFEIRDIEPVPSKPFAWVLPADEKTVVRFDASLPMAQITAREYSATFESSEIEVFDEQSAIVVPNKGPGLYTVNADSSPNIRPIKAFADMNIASVAKVWKGEVAYVLPLEDLGFYAVTRDGELIDNPQPFLKNMEVGYLLTSYGHPAIWVNSNMTTDNSWYVFVPRQEGGRWQLLPVANGSPVQDPSGKTLQLGELTLTRSAFAWGISPQRYMTRKASERAWRLEVTPTGVTALEIPASKHYGDGIRSLIVDMRTPTRVSARLLSARIVEIDLSSDAATHIDLSEGSLPISHIAATNVRGQYWVSTAERGYKLGIAEAGPDAEVSINGVRVKPGASFAAPVPSSNPRVFIKFGESPGTKWTGSVVVSIESDGERYAGKEVAYGEGGVEVQLPTSDNLEINRAYTVTAELKTEGVSVVHTWTNVSFHKSLFQRIVKSPHFVALFALLIPIAFLIGLRGSTPLGQWSPLYVPMLEVIGLPLLKMEGVAVHHVIEVSLVAGIGATIVALVSTTALRQLSELKPFDIWVTALFKIPRIRRRLLTPYLETLQQSLEAQQALYCDIPVTPVAKKPSSPVVGASLSSDEIVTLLRSGTSIVVTGFGGHGKSTLLQHVAHELAKQTDHSDVIPIYIAQQQQDPREGMLQTIRDFALTDAHAKQVFDTSSFIVIVDGPSRDKPASLSSLSQELRQRATFLIASRPDSATVLRFRDVCTNLIEVEPGRLTEETVIPFIDRYQAAGGIAKDEAARKKAWVLKAARSSDGGYVPLLVALALRAPAKGPASVAEVYRSAVEEMLPDGTESALVAEDLAYQSYWVDKTRVITAAARSVPTATVADDNKRELIGRLLDSGLLTEPPDTQGRASRPRKLEPLSVRFFHDSVQSYLAARALQRKAPTSAVSILETSAGHSVYVAASSDLLGFRGAELFQMCIAVWDAGADVPRRLEELANEWVQKHARELPAAAIDSLYESIGGDPQLVSQDPSAYLRATIDACAKADAGQSHPYHMARLVAELAPIVLAARNASPKE